MTTQDSDLAELRAAERRTSRELGQHRRRESALVLRLALKERENSDASRQLGELREATQPPHSQQTSLLLDPAVNAEIMRLRDEVREARKREREATDELQASGFNQGSIAGKQLMKKCTDLQEENAQLGKDLSEGRMQKLKADAALQKEHAGELRKALAETREWVEHLTEELDTSQAIVLSLRRELSAAKAGAKAEGGAGAKAEVKAE